MEKQVQSNPVTVENERVDDIPLLLGLIMKLELPALIDRCLPTHGNWTGLSIGWLVSIWLSYILTEHDHRMNHVQDWVNQRTTVIETANFFISNLLSNGVFIDKLTKQGYSGLDLII